MATSNSKLLEATGNVWKVICWRDGNRRKRVQVIFCRAVGVLEAEAIARRISHCRCVDASPWNPETDRSVFGWIRKVEQ